MNLEIWRLISRWQKRSDLLMGQSQKLLLKVVAAVLRLTNLCESLADKQCKKVALQTTIDIVTLCGRVNGEISQRRKTAVKPCLKQEFKVLATSTKVSDKLFGDNITQDIKDVQVKKKIEEPGQGYSCKVIATTDSNPNYPLIDNQTPHQSQGPRWIINGSLD